MQVSVEKTQGLERRMTVQMPATTIENEINDRLRSLTKTAHIAGFRPGKVPAKLVQRKFSQQVQQEVIGETLRKSFMEAVQQAKLHIVNEPLIDSVEFKAGAHLHYTATFQVYPEFELAPLEDIQIIKPVVVVDDHKVNEVIANLRQQQTIWEPTQNPAAKGNRLVVNYTATVDGEPFEGSVGKARTLHLTDNPVLPDIEAQLIGAKAGESMVLNSVLPADYVVAAVAGKTAVFQIEVLSVSTPRLPELDEAFIKSLGIEAGTESALRAEIARDLAIKIQQMIQSNLKDQVIKSLLALHQFELPSALVAAEKEILQKEQTQTSKADKPAPDDSALAQQAYNRVMLGLLFGKIIEKNQFSINQARVVSLAHEMAANYEDSENMAQWYLNDKQRRGLLERLVMEEQIVEWALAQAHITEETMSLTELYRNQAA